MQHEWKVFVMKHGGQIDSKATASIEVKLVDSLVGVPINQAEAYRLKVTAKKIFIEAVTLPTGLLSASVESCEFHWHLTENQSWRLESKIFPMLNDSANTTRMPGKYYTQAEAKELVKFCKAHGMTLIPEIDMPGHSAAFIRTFRHDMQSPEGMKILKLLIEEACDVMLWYKEHFFSGYPFAYVRQTNVWWRITDAFPNEGDLTKVFPPEHKLQKSYLHDGKKYDTHLAVGARIYLRHVWGTFVPTFYKDPKENHTAYAYTYVYSPKEQEVGLCFKTMAVRKQTFRHCPANGIIKKVVSG